MLVGPVAGSASLAPVAAVFAALSCNPSVRAWSRLSEAADSNTRRNNSTTSSLISSKFSCHLHERKIAIIEVVVDAVERPPIGRERGRSGKYARMCPIALVAPGERRRDQR